MKYLVSAVTRQDQPAGGASTSAVGTQYWMLADAYRLTNNHALVESKAYSWYRRSEPVLAAELSHANAEDCTTGLPNTTEARC